MEREGLTTAPCPAFKAFFFDMDGVVFNSMPRHAKAWEVVMGKYGLPFTAYDCYLQEGRTGQSVIDECFLKARGRHAREEEWKAIYREKSNMFYEQGPAELIPGIKDLLFWLHSLPLRESRRGSSPSQPLIFLVTGSGQRTLLDELDSVLPGIFARERMVTAFDYQHGKPDPEPYLMAYEKALSLALSSPINSSPKLGAERLPDGTGRAASAERGYLFLGQRSMKDSTSPTGPTSPTRPKNSSPNVGWKSQSAFGSEKGRLAGSQADRDIPEDQRSMIGPSLSPLSLDLSIPLAKEECCVVENAPLGVQSGKAAGLFVVGVNTGILKEKDLYDAGADIVFPSMPALHAWLQSKL